MNVNAEINDEHHEDGPLQFKESYEGDKLREAINDDEIPNLYESSVERDVDLEKSNVKETNLIDLNGSDGHSKLNRHSVEHTENKSNSNTTDKCVEFQENLVNKTVKKPVKLLKTSCGDAHNIGLDTDGKAYSLPSPLDFDPFPSGSTHKVSKYIQLWNCYCYSY